MAKQAWEDWPAHQAEGEQKQVQPTVAGVQLNLHIGQHVRHTDYDGQRVTGKVQHISIDSERGLMVEIVLDEPIIIPASEHVREIKVYRQYAPAHEFQPFDERDELIAEMLAALQAMRKATEFMAPNHDVLTGADAIACQSEYNAARASSDAAIAKVKGGAA